MASAAQAAAAEAAHQMLSVAEAARQEVDAYLDAAQRKSLLRFITCGSVDDGKSTLIGRLLYDSKMLFEDQLAALASDSLKSGTQGEELDFALLVDGLGAEREQGITIDVAYRFFATDKRKFIVADTPGHEQYTRNMVTGASTADAAVILIDARKGVLTQTRRHSYLVKLLGIRNIVLAVNKIDLVDYSQARFDEIVDQYRTFADEAGIEAFTAIPVSGLKGDNVTARSEAMSWYGGSALLEHLEAIPIAADLVTAPFRLDVQWVNRPHAGFRGYAGRIAGGSIRPGDLITVYPSRQSSRVQRIVTFDGDLDIAVEGQSVTLTLEDELDCSRGNIIVASTEPQPVVDSLAATLVWMSEEALVPGRSYWLKMGTQTVAAHIEKVDHVVDVNSLEKGPGRPLALNDIGAVAIRLDRRIPAIIYAESRRLGGFILIDKVSHETLAAGMVDAIVQRAEKRPVADDEEGRILWLTGASHAEQLALAAATQQKLDALGHSNFLLDEETLRGGIGSDLGEAPGDRAEYARRVREIARLMSRAGVHVLVAADIAPDEAHPGRSISADDIGQKGADEWVI
ncbi:sulfate adenylyltransferase subunit CysN [Sphingosinicella rhizophila]|uniref:Sulfate adenylyltransferase subunit 1 n=1 Tax=Sphingosinicella rhizophila TaxID=3050082 RepID=A0ABU3Q1V4_9SPHN|nr:sulfate adenylyltransferase subunit CysN [Sphingosinicella sp. GR2756]MDT9597397.1 sulfate adenylyltransferase subunit CysN [Sphingosinicella sp. GR2756]